MCVGAVGASGGNVTTIKSERLDKMKVQPIIECDTASSNSNSSEIPHLYDLIEYLCTLKGSRIMQEYLKKASINSVNLIIDRIKDDFGRLMSDSYGNYFC
jgi:hypothetical protein